MTTKAAITSRRVILCDESQTPSGSAKTIVVARIGCTTTSRPTPSAAACSPKAIPYAAMLVRARLRGRDQEPFRYRDKGNLATIGRARAVADLHTAKLSGFLAWVTWLVVHLWYLIGFQNRLLVLIRWSFSFITHGRSGRVIEQFPPQRAARPPS